MTTRTLIIGGAGFIGSHLATRCVEAGAEVHVLVRATTMLDRLAGLGNDIAVHRASLADEASLAACLDGVRPHRIFHMVAATQFRSSSGIDEALESMDEDLGGFLRLLKVAAAMDRPPEVVIRTGSIAEYGTGPAPSHEWQREAPLTSYAAALAAGTHYAGMLQPHLPFPLVTARLALVYGPDQSEDFLIPALIANCIEGERFLVERPRDRRDFIHIDDVVEGLLTLAERFPVDGGVLNISTGVAPTVAEVVRLVVECTAADEGLVEIRDASAHDDISVLCSSPDHMRAATGWRARINIADGIRDCVARYRVPHRLPA